MFGNAARGTSGVAHRSERSQRSMWTGAVIRSDCCNVEPGESLGRRRRLDSTGRFGVVVEREERHDRQG